MKFFGVPPPQHDRRGARPADHEVRRLDDVADDVDVPGTADRDAAPATAPCRSTNRRWPDRRSAPTRGTPPSGCRRARSRSRGARRAGRGTRGSVYGRRSSVRTNAAIHSSFSTNSSSLAYVSYTRSMRSACSAASSLAGRADVVTASARLVQIVIEVGAGRDETVDVALGDQVRDDEPHAAGAERAGEPEEDRAVAREHLLPDPPRGREVAALEGDVLHPRQHFVHCRDPAGRRTARPEPAGSATCSSCARHVNSRRSAVGGRQSRSAVAVGSHGRQSAVGSQVGSRGSAVGRSRVRQSQSWGSAVAVGKRVAQNARPMRPKTTPLFRSVAPSWRQAAPEVNVTGSE